MEFFYFLEMFSFPTAGCAVLCAVGIRKLIKLNNCLDIQSYKKNRLRAVVFVVLGLLGTVLFVSTFFLVVLNMHRPINQWFDRIFTRHTLQKSLFDLCRAEVL